MSFQYYEPNPTEAQTLKPMQNQPVTEPPPAYTTGHSRSSRSYITMHASFTSGSQPHPEPQTQSPLNSTPERPETNPQPNPFLACIFCPVTTLYACCICLWVPCVSCCALCCICKHRREF
ncbi:hypothetical protein DFH06DRAFT_1472421 [Mycena polygramma]|nr:hypothetical protein DFH06DRAFT_1472421 [Mycena polygramma]